MMAGHVAEATVQVRAPAERVWAALTDPALVRQYLMGAEVASDWQPGSPVTWSGEYGGRAYVDKGEVLEADPPRRLVHTHFSPLTGTPDVPESYHTLTWQLSDDGAGTTTVTLAQDNNATPEEAAHNRENWSAVLRGLARVAEAS